MITYGNFLTITNHFSEYIMMYLSSIPIRSSYCWCHEYANNIRINLLITKFRSAPHLSLSLSWPLLAQSTPPSYLTSLTSIPCGLFFFRFLNQNLTCIFIVPTCATCPACLLLLLNLITSILFGAN